MAGFQGTYGGPFAIGRIGEKNFAGGGTDMMWKAAQAVEYLQISREPISVNQGSSQ